MSIKVRARMDSMGNIFVSPVSDRWARRFAQRAHENGGPADEECFFQEGMGAQEFIESDCPPRHRKALQEGYPVTFMADPWIVGHWYGYDAHTVVEGK